MPRIRRRLAAATALAVFGSLLGAAPALAERRVVISGGGWGHGMGMSQYGAYGRALAGWRSRAILKHYYTGVRVEAMKMPSTVRVGLLQGRPSMSLETAATRDGGGRVELKVKGRGRIVRGREGSSFRIDVSSTGGMRLYKNGDLVKRDGRTVFGSPSRPVVAHYDDLGTKLYLPQKGTSYRHGRLKFETYASGSCGSRYCGRLVVALGMQKYLLGLAEVPSSWPGEVLKAQATAARTYVTRKIRAYGQHRITCNCAVYDSTYDQVYAGDRKRIDSGPYWDDWVDAVDATRGQVITYEGAPIDALYSSSSGGHTENNENVWGTAPVPYLRGVGDGFDDVAANPNHTWRISMSWSAFSSRLDSYFGTGALDRFEVLSPLGVSGRVTVVKSATRGGVKIVGSARSVRASGYSVKSALGLKDTLFRVKLGDRVGKTFRSRYDRLGGATGDPVSDVYSVPRGLDQSLGKAQDFRRGRLTFNRSTDKVLWQYGPILKLYDDSRREKSSLGMPLSDVKDRDGHRLARYANGFITWSPDAGPHTVRGAFGVAYDELGRAQGVLGVAVGERERPETFPGGGRRQYFWEGALYENPSLDVVFELTGRIANRYLKLGEAASACGYPIAGMTADGDSVSADFEHGTITWTAAGEIAVECS